MAAVKRKPEDWCVYIGPSIRGIVQHGDVFAGGVTAAKKTLAKGIERYPGIAILLIPGSALPMARLQVKTPGNALCVTARALEKTLEGR